MILKEYKLLFTEALSATYPKTEIDTFFYFLMEEYLGFERIDTVINPDFEIAKEKEILLKTAIIRLQKEEPIQYILGSTEFYGFPFKVNKNTLIPRPETEELVEWVLLEAAKLQKLSTEKLQILDIGTGSGCIPISIAKNIKSATISAIDISTKALKVAQQNAILNHVNIDFIENDILKATELPKQYDIIISNPPYVRNLEKNEIKNNVLDNEPHLALFVEDKNPLIFYDKIADLGKQHLSKNGLLFFEINQYLGKETVAMLKEKGYTNIVLKKDFSGNDRMIQSSL